MKSLMILGTALSLVPFAAGAADLPQPLPRPDVVPVFTWTGLYAGVNIGYGGDSYRYPFTLSSPTASILSPNASLNSSGILGGGQVGYNLQLPIAPIGPYASAIVVGVEGDVDAASIDGNATLHATSPLARGNATGSIGTRTNAFGTARGRIGFTIGRALFYGTGGYAFARAHTNSSATIGGVGTRIQSATTVHDGVAFGGGIEYLMAPNISFKVEYLRATLDTKIVASGTSGIRSYSIGERPTENIIRAGANYHLDIFGAGSGVVTTARY